MSTKKSKKPISVNLEKAIENEPMGKTEVTAEILAGIKSAKEVELEKKLLEANSKKNDYETFLIIGLSALVVGGIAYFGIKYILKSNVSSVSE